MHILFLLIKGSLHFIPKWGASINNVDSIREGRHLKVAYCSKLLVINDQLREEGGSKNRKNESTSFIDAHLQELLLVNRSLSHWLATGTELLT